MQKNKQINFMDDKVKAVLESTKEGMIKSIEHLENELTKIRAGKAHPSMLDSIKVDYYGTPSSLSHVANVSTPDSKTITIQPYEKKMIAPIERGISEANLGLNPQNDGVLIRITLPPLTEERRKQLVKQCKEVCEDGRVVIRGIRKNSNESLKKLLKDSISEDEVKTGEAEVQKLTDKYIAMIEDLFVAKDAEIMTV